MKYVAILNKTNFEGFYTRVFEYPDDCSMGPAWYYLNRIDLQGCLERVFPADMFIQTSFATKSLLCVNCKSVNHGVFWMKAELPSVYAAYAMHTLTLCPECARPVESPL